jgi:hypothetical protein
MLAIVYSVETLSVIKIIQIVNSVRFTLSFWQLVYTTFSLYTIKWPSLLPASSFREAVSQDTTQKIINPIIVSPLNFRIAKNGVQKI